MPQRKRNNFEEDLAKFVIVIFVILIVGLFSVIKTFWENYSTQIIISILLLSVGIIVVGSYLFNKKRKKSFNFSDERKILYMLKGMMPDEFEQEIANMFNRYRYKTEVVGHSHDGGIDVIAKRDGKTYLVQCKKQLTRKAGVVDVRSFYGVVSKNNADGGFFITTNEFTPEVWGEFKNDKKIKLVDKTELVKFYKKSLEKKM